MRKDYHTAMDRTIRVRSLNLDKAEAGLSALGKMKERELEDAGIISSPLFSALCIAPDLEDGKLGYFSPEGKVIVISENVINTAGEDAIRNIFLHELAHALDFALHGSLSGHSPAFRECCRVLGVDKGFEKSRVRTSITSANDKRDRVKKLLALSSSPFENEAAEAIKKAKLLMARDGITLDEDKEEKIYMVPLYQGARFPFSIRMLLTYISKTTGVYVVISQDTNTKTAIAYGSLEETEASIYLYDYLISAAEREIKTLRKNGERISKDSFLRGALTKLTEKTADKSSDNALVAIRDENRKLAKKIVFSNTKLTSAKVRAHGGDVSSYTKGMGFGAKLSVPSAIGRKELE